MTKKKRKKNKKRKKKKGAAGDDTGEKMSLTAQTFVPTMMTGATSSILPPM